MQLAQSVSKKLGFVKTSDSTRDESSGAAAPPEWEEDQTCEDCCCCLVKFTVTRRKHHCRRCGRVVCGVCSWYRLPIPEMGFLQPVRVCVECNCALTSLARGIDLQAVAEYVVSECRPPLAANRTAKERCNTARVDQAYQELANLRLMIREHEMNLEKAHGDHQMLDFAQQLNAMTQQVAIITEQLRQARADLGQVVTGVVATEEAEFHDPRYQRYLVVTPGPDVILAISGLCNNRSTNKNGCFKGGLRFMCAKTIDELIKVRRCKIQVNSKEQTPKILRAVHFQWEQHPQQMESDSSRPMHSLSAAPLPKSTSSLGVTHIGTLAPKSTSTVMSTEFFITSEVSEKIRRQSMTGVHLSREDEVGKPLYELLQVFRKKYFDRVTAQKRIFEDLVALKSRQVSWSNEADASLLREMWKALRTDPFPGTKSEKWKELGFQGMDPVTDLRGMGALTPHCLLYWARTYPQYASALVAQQKHRAYPICASAINICSLVADLTGLSAKSTATRPLFLLFCRSNTEPGSQFFEQVVSVCIALVDYVFVQSNFGYMDFPRALATVREIVSSTANANHVNFTQFMAALHDHFKEGPDTKAMTPTWPKFTGPRVTAMDMESKVYNSLSSGSETKSSPSKDDEILTCISTCSIDRSLIEEVSLSAGEGSLSGKGKLERPPRVSVYFDPPTPMGMHRSPGALDVTFGYEVIDYDDADS